MPGTYAEYRAYSPLTDQEMIRVSMWDGRGAEYYAEVPSLNGAQWRTRRETVLDAIMLAMDEGEAPGKVRVSE